MKPCLTLGSILAGILLLASGAPAEPPPLLGAGGRPFAADVLMFQDEGAKEARIWVAVSIPVQELYFEPDSAATEFTVTWKVRRGRVQVDGDVIHQRVDVEEAGRLDRSVLQMIPIRLEPGSYQITVEVASAGDFTASVAEREIRVPDPDEHPFVVSSLYLTADLPQRIRQRSSGPPGFPVVDRVVSEQVSTLTLVGELYAPHGCRERYKVSYRLVDEDEHTLQERTDEIPCEGFTTLLALPLDTGRLTFGDYRVELSVKLPRERHEIYREIWFSADETLLSLRSGFDRTLDIVQAIATEEELDLLKTAPAVEREAAWEAFWTKRDPTPDAEPNEYRTAFFERLRHANRHFSTPVTPGWKTDRGYVLLRHGHPDRIERSAHAVDQPSVEVWIYDGLGQRFRFVDDLGMGDYRLAGTL